MLVELKVKIKVEFYLEITVANIVNIWVKSWSNKIRVSINIRAKFKVEIKTKVHLLSDKQHGEHVVEQILSQSFFLVFFILGFRFWRWIRIATTATPCQTRAARIAPGMRSAA